MTDIQEGLPSGYSRQKELASAEETIQGILRKSARRNQEVPVQVAFVEGHEAPMGKLVRRHDDLAFRAHLLALAGASAEPFDISQPAAVWARALEVDEVAVSKVWARLERLGLVARRRDGRSSVLRILREDGSREPYDHPFLLEPKRRYMKVPFAFWASGLEKRLKLPGRAVLLIAMTHRAWFTMPAERAPKRFGISADTFERGIDALRREELITSVHVYKKAPLAPRGYTRENAYLLLPPYGTRRHLVPPPSEFASTETPAR